MNQSINQGVHHVTVGVPVTFRKSLDVTVLQTRARLTALLNWVVSYHNNLDGMTFLFQRGSYQQLILLCCMAPESSNHKLGARFRHNSCWAATEASFSSRADLPPPSASTFQLLLSPLSTKRFLEIKASFFFFFRKGKSTFCFYSLRWSIVTWDTNLPLTERWEGGNPSKPR